MNLKALRDKIIRELRIRHEKGTVTVGSKVVERLPEFGSKRIPRRPFEIAKKPQ